MKRRIERAETEAALSAYVDNFIQGKCVADYFVYHQRGVEEQVVCGDQIDFGQIPL